MSQARKARPLEVGDTALMRDGRKVRVVLLDATGAALRVLFHDATATAGAGYGIVRARDLVRA